jgi:hypothetical protein
MSISFWKPLAGLPTSLRAAVCVALVACGVGGGTPLHQTGAGGARGKGGASGTGGATGAGGAGSGDAAGAGGAAGSAGGTFDAAADACAQDSGDFKTDCLNCANGDPCGVCLCNDCTAQTQKCNETPGCREIGLCAKNNNCVDAVTCFCGTASAIDCAGGRGNGKCKQVVLDAPGGRTPTLTNLSAGPAADAAAALAACADPDGGPCGKACGQ